MLAKKTAKRLPHSAVDTAGGGNLALLAFSDRKRDSTFPGNALNAIRTAGDIVRMKRSPKLKREARRRR
jgi:hypothetical protein